MESHIPSTDVSFSPFSLAEILRTTYQQEAFASLHRLFYDQQFPLAHSFINLALIKHVEYQQKTSSAENNASTPGFSHQASWHDAWLSGYEHSHRPQEPIEADTIFEAKGNNSNQTPHHILVEGRAGIGKSTLCRYLAYQWALGEQGTLPQWVKRFDLVVWLPLRQLMTSINENVTKTTYTIIAQFIYEQLPEVDQEDYPLTFIETALKALEKAKKVLYLFDGYDEVATLANHSAWQKIFEKLWQKPYWLLTARPHYFTWSSAADFRHMEILGFTDANIKQYVQQFFLDFAHDQTNSQETEQAHHPTTSLQTYLEQNPIMWSIAHIPVNLELLCNIWQNEWMHTQAKAFSSSLSDDPITLPSLSTELSMSELYERLLSFLVRRFVEERLNHQDSHIILATSSYQQLLNQLKPAYIPLTTLDQAYPNAMPYLTLLETLAWRGMDRAITVFSPDDYQDLVRAAFNQPSHYSIEKGGSADILAFRSFKELGLLRSTGKFNKASSLDQSYEFLHLTFQEYLAAQYFIRCLITDQKIVIWESEKQQWLEQDIKAFMLERRYQPRYFYVWCFAAGLLSKYPQALSEFFTTLLSKPADVVGLYSSILNWRCLEEGSRLSLTKLFYDEAIVQSMMYWVKQCMQTEAASLVERVLFTQFSTSPRLTRKKVIPLLLQLLTNTQNKRTQRSIVRALGQLGSNDVEVVVPELLRLFTSTQDELTQGSIVYALGEIGLREAKLIVPELLRLFSNTQVKGTQRSIVYALGEIGLSEAKLVVLELFQLLISIQDKSIQGSIMRALWQLGSIEAKLIVPELLRLLVSAQDEETQRKIVEALGTVGSTEAKLVVPELLRLLVSTQGEETQRSIVYSLGQIGFSEAKLVVPELLRLLISTQEEETQRSIVYALKQVGSSEAKVVMPELLRLLVSTQSEETQKGIVYALGKIKSNEAKVIVPELLRLLASNQDKMTQRNIVKALGQIGSSETKAVVPELLRLLASNQDEWTQRSIVYELGQLGSSETKAVVPELLRLLASNQNERTQRNFAYVVDALGQIGFSKAKVVVPELLRLLVNTQGEEIQQSIVKTLGRIGLSEAKMVVPELLRLLASTQNEKIQISTIGALEQIGSSETKVIISELFKLVKSNNIEYFSNEIAQILSKLNLAHSLTGDKVNQLLQKMDRYKIVQSITNTPLSSLLELYHQQLAPAYLIIIILKCLNENKALTYHQGKLYCFDHHFIPLRYIINEKQFCEHLQQAYSHPIFGGIFNNQLSLNHVSPLAISQSFAANASTAQNLPYFFSTSALKSAVQKPQEQSSSFRRLTPLLHLIGHYGNAKAFLVKATFTEKQQVLTLLTIQDRHWLQQVVSIIKPTISQLVVNTP